MEVVEFRDIVELFVKNYTGIGSVGGSCVAYRTEFDKERSINYKPGSLYHMLVSFCMKRKESEILSPQKFLSVLFDETLPKMGINSVKKYKFKRGEDVFFQAFR